MALPTPEQVDNDSYVTHAIEGLPIWSAWYAQATDTNSSLCIGRKTRNLLDWYAGLEDNYSVQCDNHGGVVIVACNERLFWKIFPEMGTLGLTHVATVSTILL